jgi:hypothetical protein
MNAYFAVKDVQPIENFELILTFSNKEKRLFDVKPFLKKGIFKELLDEKMFKTVHVSFDTIEWDNEADLDPEILYKLSKKINSKKIVKAKPHSVAAEPDIKYRRKKKMN